LERNEVLADIGFAYSCKRKREDDVFAAFDQKSKFFLSNGRADSFIFDE
jgi:hypothetical protein